MTSRDALASYRRWVVKIGSALLTADGQGLDHERLAGWAAQVAALRARGCQVVLVSSGAVAEGLVRLGWTRRPQTLIAVQAAASVGQAGLVEAYSRCFKDHGLQTAQVLLTHDDVADRTRYLNARNSLMTLLELGVIPIVNENDAIATDQTRVGDNDTMAALAVNLLDADALIILTDQAGVFDADPRRVAGARQIESCAADDPMLIAAAGASGGALGRGGMQTKIRAARQAADSGAVTVIAHGLVPRVLESIILGENIGTLLTAGPQRKRTARKNWIAGQRQVRGRITIDAGAVRVLRQAGRSLLPIGITAVEGDFRRGDLVSCVAADGEEIARGLANYDARETGLLRGQSSARIMQILGYDGAPEFIHRDNMTLSHANAALPGGHS